MRGNSVDGMLKHFCQLPVSKRNLLSYGFAPGLGLGEFHSKIKKNTSGGIPRGMDYLEKGVVDFLREGK